MLGGMNSTAPFSWMTISLEPGRGADCFLSSVISCCRFVTICCSALTVFCSCSRSGFCALAAMASIVERTTRILVFINQSVADCGSVLHEISLQRLGIAGLHQAEHEKNARLLRTQFHRRHEAELVVVHLDVAHDDPASGPARAH